MRHVTPSKKLAYIRSLYANEDEVLVGIREALEQMNFCIQVGAEEGKFLQSLIHLHQPKKIVEIGTLGGYSAIWMARALPKGGHIYTLEKQARMATLARESIAEATLEKQITVIEGKANETLPILSKKGKFDMVFIDADKINYLKYLNWAEANVKKGGLIVADNTLLFDTVYLDYDDIPENADIRKTTHKNLQTFNRRLSDPQKYHSVMLPTKEGLTVAIKLY